MDKLIESIAQKCIRENLIDEDQAEWLLAMLCLSLLGVESLGRLFRAGKPFLHLPIWLAGAAGLLTTICLAMNFVGRSLPPLAACISGNPLPAVGNAVTAADETAMQWLQELEPEDCWL